MWLVEGTLLDSKAQNLPWGLWSPTVATYLSALVELEGVCLAEMAHLYLWMHFPSLTGKKTCGKHILLDGMVHVYLHGYCPSGSAMHRHSMLMGREMWNKHFVFLCSTHFIQLSYKFGPILFRTALPTLLSQKEGNYTHIASLNSFFVLLLNVFAPHLCNIICLHTHTDPYTPGCTGASMLTHPWSAKPKKKVINF